MSSASSLLVWGIKSPLPCSYLDPIIPLNYNSREEKKSQQRSGNRNSDRIDRVRARRINARSATRRYPIREEETTKKKRGEEKGSARIACPRVRLLLLMDRLPPRPAAPGSSLSPAIPRSFLLPPVPGSSLPPPVPG